MRKVYSFGHEFSKRTPIELVLEPSDSFFRDEQLSCWTHFENRIRWASKVNISENTLICGDMLVIFGIRYFYYYYYLLLFSLYWTKTKERNERETESSTSRREKESLALGPPAGGRRRHAPVPTWSSGHGIARGGRRFLERRPEWRENGEDGRKLGLADPGSSVHFTTRATYQIEALREHYEYAE